MSNTTAILRGRLTRDPEIAPVGQKQTLLAKFSVACDEGQGEHKKTAYIDCVAWGRLADDVRGLAKGDPVAVFGHLEQQNWEDRATGGKRSKLVVIVEVIDGVAKSSPAQSAAARDQPVDGYDDHSLPF